MNPSPFGLTTGIGRLDKIVTEPVAFVREVEARAALDGLTLHVEQIDVWFRYYWEWRRTDGSLVQPREEVLSCNRDEVRLRACLQFCREMGWPIAYVPGCNIHLDIERVPKGCEAAGPTVPASSLRHAGAYVPEHVRDFEPIQLAQ